MMGACGKQGMLQNALNDSDYKALNNIRDSSLDEGN
jgi:hypothetical protein